MRTVMARMKRQPGYKHALKLSAHVQRSGIRPSEQPPKFRVSEQAGVAVLKFRKAGHQELRVYRLTFMDGDEPSGPTSNMVEVVLRGTAIETSPPPG